MRIVVMCKSVPDTMDVRFDPQTKTMVRAGVATTINPFDLFAIEAALRLREQHGGTVTAMTMGPSAAQRELQDAIAMGCDDAVLLSSPAYAGSDTWATAYALACAVRYMGEVDLIVCGRQAQDGDTGQVGPGIARQLGWPQVTYVSRVCELDLMARRIVVERLLEDGRQTLAAQLPAVMTVLKDANLPRTATLRGMRRAHRAVVPTWGPEITGADPRLVGLDGSPTRVVRVFSPTARQGQVQWITAATPQKVAEGLLAALTAEQLV
ncbi:MAG: electron transfer flavoprotein subunit beta/FixA family protein [Chloroflexi bacterium]|nr:electron transfer flavoprotein subunit beta/FixA family protein [Chloroflexota bacterium]